MEWKTIIYRVNTRRLEKKLIHLKKLGYSKNTVMAMVELIFNKRWSDVPIEEREE